MFSVVSADLLLLRANITKLSELPENISDVDRSIKANLNTLFHSKTGKLMRGEGCSKSFDEVISSRLDETKEKGNGQFKHL